MDHPALPITPDELAEVAQQSQAAGAAMIHLHVRDEHGKHSLDVARYRDAIAAIRARIGKQLIIQVTSEAVGVYSTEQQMAMVRELRPEAVSLAIRELCPQGAEQQAADFFAWLASECIAPQYILYCVEDVARFESLRDRGVISGECPSVLYVLGCYGDSGDASVAQLRPILAASRRPVIWSVCAFGAAEAACMKLAAKLGGHCRVGFENNLLLASGKTAPDNSALVAQLVATVARQGRSIASSVQARELMGLA